MASSSAAIERVRVPTVYDNVSAIDSFIKTEPRFSDAERVAGLYL